MSISINFVLKKVYHEIQVFTMLSESVIQPIQTKTTFQVIFKRCLQSACSSQNQQYITHFRSHEWCLKTIFFLLLTRRKRLTWRLIEHERQQKNQCSMFLSDSKNYHHHSTQKLSKTGGAKRKPSREINKTQSRVRECK